MSKKKNVTGTMVDRRRGQHDDVGVRAMPTPEEIKLRAEKIREQWTDKERLNRGEFCGRTPWKLIEVADQDITFKDDL